MQEDSPRPEGADYLNFDLEIGIGTGRDYPVAVLDSPAGGARGNMHFPFDELVLENRLLTLQNALLRSGGEPRRTLSPEEQKVRDFGRALFEALFIPEVRSCYDVSLREAARQGRGLRLKLRIQPPELAALPWEYLYHPGQCEYVSLSTQTPVVRYLEVPQRVQPLVVEPPLRILGMIASPSDLPSLDIEREKGRIEHAIQDLQARGMVDLVWLPGQSWRDLQRAMRQGPWHIFHFIGHGGFDRNAGEGLIALADREGRADRFHATRLGRLLADHPSLRLVLLNSCEGARGSERDVFSSTASILVRRGIPAVLAMQYEITDRAAVEFARTFYEALADGMPVDGAVAEARKAISFAVANTVEWGTPVLYTRAPGGVLFQVTGAPHVERPTTEEPRPPPQVEKRLERLYVDGLGAFWIEEWDEACRCFQAIVDEQPDYRDAAARLEQAEHQRRLVAFYTEAQAARAAKDWTGEFMALDRLVAEEPGFKDAADLREAAKRKRQLARLYAQAQELHAAGRWQAVVNVFARIAALDPDYPDPDELLPAAEREVAEQKRQGELDDLYSHALREMDAGQWGEARGLLAQIQEMEAGHRETERLLARAEAEIADQERQAELDGLYSDALQAVEAGRWQAARGLLAQVQEMEGGYRETERLLAEAEAALAKQGRQAELDGLYSRALREMNTGRWAEARQLLIEIQEQEPGYRATERLLAEAEARLEQETTARQAREAQRTSEPAAVTRPTASRRRLPVWVMAAIGGLGLITFIVAVVLLSGGLGGKVTPAATEAPAQEAMPEPTEAPAEVDFPVMPGGFLEKAIAGEYAGTEVTVDGPFEDPDALYFFESMEAFEEATGITVNYIGDREFEPRLASRVEAGDPPDIADFYNPGTAANYSRQGHLVDPTLWISEQWLKQQYNQSWLDMAQMHGQTGGVWHRFNTFSLVWYPKDDFEAAGYEIPTSWDELLALTQQIADDGDTAWCIGIESGASTGWVATDWTGDLMLRTTSLDNYDAWVAGTLPFDSPEVRNAIETWSNIWFNDDYVHGGRDNIVSTSYIDAPAPMFEEPPKCWLHHQGSFITDFFPEDSELGVDYDFFYFPPVDERYGKPFLVYGDLMSMFNDRPEVRALMEYFTTPQSVRGWLTNGGALAAHQTATPEMYGADLERRMVDLVQEATSFRFNGSHLMPGEVGAGSFWTGMTDYVSGATDLDTVLVDIDESWPRPTEAPAATEAPAEEAAPEPTEAPAPERVFGPSSGSLLDEVDGYIEAYSADVSLTDFVAEAMFYNPYPSTQGDWDYGFTCRRPRFDTMHAIRVESDGDWKHHVQMDGEWTLLESGTVSDLRTGADESNHLRIIVMGDSGEFYVNGQLVASLDMSGLTDAGDIKVATGIGSGGVIEGAVTRFEDFSVWSLDVPVFGPSSGSLPHEPEGGLIETYLADVSLTDFVAEAMFYNPYPSTQGDWDYGFLCRRPRHAIRVESDGDWKHHVNIDGEWILWESGTVSDLRTGADESNHLRIIVMGDSGEFYVNGQLVASLDMSELTDADDIKAATGIGDGDEIEGEVTRFEDFTIWSLD